MEQLPHIIDNRRYYNIPQAAQIIGGVCRATLRVWAKDGHTPFGMELDVKREPMVHHARSYRHDAQTHRQYRLLIPETKVLALKEILQDFPIRPGPLSDGHMAALKAAAYRHRAL